MDLIDLMLEFFKGVVLQTDYSYRLVFSIHIRMSTVYNQNLYMYHPNSKLDIKYFYWIFMFPTANTGIAPES